MGKLGPSSDTPIQVYMSREEAGSNRKNKKTLKLTGITAVMFLQVQNAAKQYSNVENPTLKDCFNISLTGKNKELRAKALAMKKCFERTQDLQDTYYFFLALSEKYQEVVNQFYMLQYGYDRNGREYNTLEDLFEDREFTSN